MPLVASTDGLPPMTRRRSPRNATNIATITTDIATTVARSTERIQNKAVKRSFLLLFLLRFLLRIVMELIMMTWRKGRSLRRKVLVASMSRPMNCMKKYRILKIWCVLFALFYPFLLTQTANFFCLVLLLVWSLRNLIERGILNLNSFCILLFRATKSHKLLTLGTLL